MSFTSSMYPKIIMDHSLKMTEARLNDWRNTMKIIVDCKNGKLPEEVHEDRHPQYTCLPKATFKQAALRAKTNLATKIIDGVHRRTSSVVKSTGVYKSPFT